MGTQHGTADLVCILPDQVERARLKWLVRLREPDCLVDHLGANLQAWVNRISNWLPRGEKAWIPGEKQRLGTGGRGTEADGKTLL